MLMSKSKTFIQLKYILLFVIIFSVKSYCAESDLIKTKNNSQNQKTLADIYFKTKVLSKINIDSSIALAQKGYEISMQTKSIDYQFKFVKICLDNYYKKQDLRNEIIYSEKLLNLIESNNIEKEKLAIYLNITSLYGKTYNYNKAFLYASKLIELSKKQNNKIMLAKAYSNLGIIFMILHDEKNALIYFNKGIQEISGIENVNSLKISLNNNIAIVYGNKKDFKKALSYQFKSLGLIKSGNNYRQFTITMMNIGYSYEQIGDYDKAINFLLKAEYYALKADNELIIADLYKNTGIVYYKLKNYQKFLFFIKRAELLAKKNNDFGVLKDIYEALSDYYLLKHDCKNSFHFFEFFKSMNDSILVSTNNNNISELKIKFETQEIGSENISLKQKEQIQELEIERLSILKNLFFLISCLILMLVFIVFHRYWLKKKTNTALSLKNNFITNQNLILEEANNTKDKFFKIIAQDIQHPFFKLRQNIIDLIENMESKDSDNYDELVESLCENSIYINKLLENLLIWAKSQVGNIEITKRKLSLQALVNESISEFLVLSVAKEQKLEIRISPDHYIFADKYTMKFVIGSIFNNAVKFTERNGKISIVSILNLDYIEIVISDNGVGIENNRLEKLFNIGKNQATLSPDNYKGTGLGLIICKDFIEKNNANITIQSKIGEGTSVYIKFKLS